MNIVLLNIKVLHYEYLLSLHYKNTQKSIPTTPIANFFQIPKKNPSSHPNAGSSVLVRANAWSETADPEGRQANGESAFAKRNKKRYPTPPAPQNAPGRGLRGPGGPLSDQRERFRVSEIKGGHMLHIRKKGRR